MTPRYPAQANAAETYCASYFFLHYVPTWRAFFTETLKLLHLQMISTGTLPDLGGGNLQAEGGAAAHLAFV